LPKDLIEAELFGHEKGAFTTANASRTGLIEAAEFGVLFLDEIGELPLELQAKLLAVLERRFLRRLGSNHERPVGAWFIAATNRDIDQMVKTEQLRADLYFRLNVLTLQMPPLRKRGHDVILLARHFAHQTASRYGLGEVEFSSEARSALTNYAWPGNVRELQHLVERAVLLKGAGEIGADALMLERAVGFDSQFDWENMTLDAAERILIEKALKRTGNNISEAARQLGVTRMTMRYRMKKYGFARGDV
jgi:DNA-binding NtrC family response regulator